MISLSCRIAVLTRAISYATEQTGFAWASLEMEPGAVIDAFVETLEDMSC